MRPADVAAPPRPQRLPLAGELAGLLASFVRLSALGGTLPLPLVGAATSAAKPWTDDGASSRSRWASGSTCSPMSSTMSWTSRSTVRYSPPQARSARAWARHHDHGAGSRRRGIRHGSAGDPRRTTRRSRLRRRGTRARCLRPVRQAHAPPGLSDVVQAAGWAALVIAGAALAGPPTALSFTVAAYVAAFIVQANGVHGAIRRSCRRLCPRCPDHRASPGCRHRGRWRSCHPGEGVSVRLGAGRAARRACGGRHGRRRRRRRCRPDGVLRPRSSPRPRGRVATRTCCPRGCSTWSRGCSSRSRSSPGSRRRRGWRSRSPPSASRC